MKQTHPLNPTADTAVEQGLSRREVMTLAGVGLLSTLLAGCGSGGGASANEVVLKPSTVVLPSDGSVTLTDITATSVTIRGAAPPITPGSVIVTSLGQGLLRKVKSATPNGADLVLQTEDAALDDAIDKARFSFRRKLTGSDFVEGPGSRGVVVRPRQSGRADTKLKFTVSERDPNTGGPKSDPGELAVTMEYDPDFLLEGEYDGEWKRVRFELSTTAVGDVDIKAKKKIELKGDWDVASFRPIPILFMLGGLPVAIQLLSYIKMVTKGTLESGIEDKYHVTGRVSAGLEYTRENGWTPFGAATGDLQPTNGTNVYASVKASVMAKLSIRALVYSVAGPRVEVSVGPEAEYKAEVNPRKQRVAAYLVGKASVGVSSGFISRILPDRELAETLDHKILVGEVVWAPGSIEGTVD